MDALNPEICPCQYFNFFVLSLGLLSEAIAGVIEVEKRRKDAVAPRWHVKQVEFDAISAYLKGRLTLDKV